MDAFVCSQNDSTPVEARTVMVTDAAPVKLSVLSQHLTMTMGIVTTQMFSLSNRSLFVYLLFGKNKLESQSLLQANVKCSFHTAHFYIRTL